MQARIVAAVILGPPVLLAFYLGSPVIDLLVVAVVAIAGWEWVRLCQGGRVDHAGWIAVALGPAVALLARFGEIWQAGAVTAAGALVFLVLSVATRSVGSKRVFLLTLAGPLYVCAAGLAVLWIRDPLGSGNGGLILVLWLVLTVWATDVFAFIVGRSLGGPKLAPRISPGKTWSGLAGGMLAASVVGLVFAHLAQREEMGLLSGTISSWIVPAGLGAMLAVIAQAGDLMESGLKRRFGAKDSGGLIPGHGGMLDRIDGLVPAAIAVALLIWLGGAPF